MTATSFGRRFRIWALALICLAIGACTSVCNGRPSDGTYHHTGGAPMVLDFKGSRVTVSIAGESQTFDYRMDGTTVIIVNPEEGDITFVRNDDGSLTGHLGTFARRAS